MNCAQLANSKVLIVGLGVTGQSVARFLIKHGVQFDIAERNPLDKQTLKNLLGPLRAEIYQEFSADLFCSYEVIILSPGISRAHPAIIAALNSGAHVIGDIELFASAVSCPVVAVTGSNGKSTVVAWLEHVLSHMGVNTKACGNIGDAALDSIDEEADLLILELSSYQLESTYSLRALVAVVLNVSEDHMDRYDDIEHYATVKRRIYNHASYCVANRDDNRTWPEYEQFNTTHWFTLDSSQTSVLSVSANNLNAVNLSLPGDHNKANALAIIAIFRCLQNYFGPGFADQPELFIEALAQFTGLPHRSQLVVEKSGVRWYNDSKGTNIDACMKAIEAMPGAVILIAGGQGKGADFTQLRSIVSDRVRLLILIGEDRQLIAEALSGCTEIHYCDSLQDAVALAHSHVVSGEVVLLSPACASFDMFSSFSDRGEQFVAAVHQELAA